MPKAQTVFILAFAWLLLLGVKANSALGASYDGQLEIVVIEEQSGEPIAVRMELTNSRGRPVAVRAEGVVTRKDYFVFDGQVTLRLKKGNYRFLVDAGPEYQTRQGHFTIERHADDSKQITLKRYVDMASEGWRAGDLDVHERPDDLPLMMQAARIDFAPRSLGQNLNGKFRKPVRPLQDGSGTRLLLDHRGGGGLLLLGLEDTAFDPTLISILGADASSMATLNQATEIGAEVVALNPYAWDLPLWIAADKLTAVQILHRQTWSDPKNPNEGWDRPRDQDIYSGKQGNGIYSEDIYHRLLNCGIRIPPAAGTGAGSNSLPLGVNRTYVECGTDYSEQDWLTGLRAGRVIVTNGPLLRTKVEGHAPGHVFHLDRDEQREFQIALSLSFYERAPVEYLEIVKNGRVEYNIRLSDLAKKQGRLPPLEFDKSGWFLVRAVTSSTETYQYATTGPYYVEQHYQSRISRASVNYFLEWLEAAASKFADNEAVLADIAKARPFWEDLLTRANDE